jgi:hypothetical protein
MLIVAENTHNPLSGMLDFAWKQEAIY